MFLRIMAINYSIFLLGFFRLGVFLSFLFSYMAHSICH